jgi:hypothetical protein
MTTAEKAERLRMAITALQDADALMQEALGATTFCWETHNQIQEIVDELVDKVIEWRYSTDIAAQRST